MKNLELRGQHEDGNAGLVMSRAGKLLLRCGTSDCVVLADELLRKGRQLIEAAQDEEVNLAHEVLEIDPPQRFTLNFNVFFPIFVVATKSCYSRSWF